MLIFKNKSVSIKASRTEISKALKNLAQKNTPFKSFAEDSFSFVMWEKQPSGYEEAYFSYMNRDILDPSSSIYGSPNGLLL